MSRGGPTRRLAVLGSPIAHSLSPMLHREAYRRLELPWVYDAVDVPSGGLAGFLGSLDETWRGLSLTMPLKREVLPLLATTDSTVDETGSANTVVIDGGRLHGYNTDVDGIVRAVRPLLATARTVHVLGSGATAASAVVAARRLGAERVVVRARSAERARASLPVDAPVSVEPLDGTPVDEPDLVVSTLPGGTSLQDGYGRDVRRRALLLDVAYSPWPSELASRWVGDGGLVVSGVDMLVHQAVGQVRLFRSGGLDDPLPGEGALRSDLLTLARAAAAV